MEPTRATSTVEIDEIELMERELELTLTEEPKEKAGAKPDKSEAQEGAAGKEKQSQIFSTLLNLTERSSNPYVLLGLR